MFNSRTILYKFKKKQFYDRCYKKEQSNTICTRNNGDKNCQAEKSDIQPVKPAKDMQSNRLEIPIHKKMTKKSKIVPHEDDKNCQSTKYYGLVCGDKKCQATKCYKKVDTNCQATNMYPVKPEIDMQSVTRSSNEKLVGSASDKICQATICYQKQKKCEHDDFKSQSSMCSNKNCQENINMWPVMPEKNMWLPKPAVLYQYTRLCNDKNCQSIRCNNAKSPVRPMYGYDKNCQETLSAHMQPKKPSEI